MTSLSSIDLNPLVSFGQSSNINIQPPSVACPVIDLSDNSLLTPPNMSHLIQKGDSPYTLGLNMIVKDESHIIVDTLKMLCSKLKLHYWVICDTGSTDNTPELITNFFNEKGIPGELHRHVWKDFAHNRTLALEAAKDKTDALLIFDADDEIVGDIPLPAKIEFTGYHLNFGFPGGFQYSRILIIDNHKKWEFKSVLHEYINCCEPNQTSSFIEGPYFVVSGRKGSRNKDPQKYLKDAHVLEKAYAEAKATNDPLYNRYSFYCANSYKDYGDYENAVKWYKNTLDLSTVWHQEKFVCCFSIFECYRNMKQIETGLYYLVESMKYDSERVECICELVQYYCTNGLPSVAYKYYELIKDFYENRYLLNPQMNDKFWNDKYKYEMIMPFYTVLVADRLHEKGTICKMYEIVFSRKNGIINDFYIGNFLYNLQFFIEDCIKLMPEGKFVQLFKDYVHFLRCANYSFERHQFMRIFEKYGVYAFGELGTGALPTAASATSNNSFEMGAAKKSKNVLIYVGYSERLWNKSYEKTHALGGSETAVNALASQFPPEYTIYIAGMVEEEVVDNLHYVPYEKIKGLVADTIFHTLIVSRYISFYELFPETKFYQSFIWAHDVFLYPYGCQLDTNSLLSKWNAKINGCICQTKWHCDMFRSMYTMLGEKIKHINNGICTELFELPEVATVKRISGRFIYTSCTERGLDRLLALWPEIKEKMPNAELVITTYNVFPRNDEEKKLEELIKSLPDVNHLGQLNKVELYKLMRSAEYWLYPTHFSETSCITSMEMLMSGVICVYYPIAGLKDTLGNYGIAVEEGDGREMRAIMRLTEEEKYNIRRRGIKYIREECSWKKRFELWNSNELRLGDISDNDTYSRNGQGHEYKDEMTSMPLNASPAKMHMEKEMCSIIEHPSPLKIINLKHRTDRFNFMTEQLKDAGYSTDTDKKEYQFVNAVDASQTQLTAEMVQLFRNNNFSYKKGCIGSALSHIMLWKALTQDAAHDYYIILEDDIKLVQGFKEKLERVCNEFHAKSLEHIALGEYLSAKPLNVVTDQLRILPKDIYVEGHQVFAYIISKSAAHRMCDFFHTCTIKAAIDCQSTWCDMLKYHTLNQPIIDASIINSFGSDANYSNSCYDVVASPFNSLVQPVQHVKIAFCDWWEMEYGGGKFDTHNNCFVTMMRLYNPAIQIQVVEPRDTPDVLLYSVFGNVHNFIACKRKIFFTGEPYAPDSAAQFNFTFDVTSWEKKNIRYPLWAVYFNEELLWHCKQRAAGNPTVPAGHGDKGRNEFCSLICRTDNVEGKRGLFVDLVQQRGKGRRVVCGGQFRNNMADGQCVPRGEGGSGKVDFNRGFKFSMAFENKRCPGYVTEKIMDVYRSGCVPIYWGTEDVVKDFNPSTFINANDFATMEKLVDFVIKVDESAELYAGYFRESPLRPCWMNVFTDPYHVYFRNIGEQIVGHEKDEDKLTLMV